MDVRRSFYVAAKQDDFAGLDHLPKTSRVDCSGIVYITAANDNFRVKIDCQPGAEIYSVA
jgi:hypothetical protein